ncbi:hypothetical protein BGX28_005034, partial [Mortierella sp. GBA30]
MAPEMTLHAIVFLTGSASLWWESIARLSRLCTLWDKFNGAFRAEFRPAGFMDHIRGLVLKTKFTYTLSEYISIIRRLRGMLMSSTPGDEGKMVQDDTIKSSFLEGVPKELNQVLLSYEVVKPQASDIYGILT